MTYWSCKTLVFIRPCGLTAFPRLVKISVSCFLFSSKIQNKSNVLSQYPGLVSCSLDMPIFYPVFSHPGPEFHCSISIISLVIKVLQISESFIIQWIHLFCPYPHCKMAEPSGYSLIGLLICNFVLDDECPHGFLVSMAEKASAWAVMLQSSNAR